MKNITKIIVGIIVIVILVSVSVGIWLYINTGWDGLPGHFVMGCEKDLINKTLRVIIVEKPSFFNWSDIELIKGNATFPTGFIDLGDMISNCSGEVTLVYKPYEMLLGEWPFLDSDKVIFIEKEKHENSELIEGNFTTILTDGTFYWYDNETQNLSGTMDGKINDSLMIILGDIWWYSGDTEQGGGAGLVSIYSLPYQRNEFGIINLDTDGTVFLKYNEIDIVLKPGQEWTNISIENKTYNSPEFGMVGTIKYTYTVKIVNNGFLMKDKLNIYQ
jgi:hypothetical protein